MVHRSERAVQRNIGFQHVPGTALPVSVPVHGTVVHVVHRTVLLSHRFRHGPGTERNRRLHDHKHHRSYEHRWNGTYDGVTRAHVLYTRKRTENHYSSISSKRGDVRNIYTI